jgi:transcriptional regulator with XRE-family HTH domain
MRQAELAQIREALGRRIRLLRKQEGYSQEEFADLVGLHRTYIGAIERGERNVSIDNIAKMANGLDLKISFLLEIELD